MRKQAEEILLNAGALQKAIFDSANFSSIATDAEGVIQIFNVGAERMLGYAAADVMNKITPADISDPQEVIARAQALSAELGTPIAPGFKALVFKASRGIEDIYELTYIRKDGSRFPAVVSVTALRNTQDVIIGYLLIGTDNRARKQAEEALRENADLLRRIHLNSIVSVADRAGCIIDVSDTFCTISGYSRRQLLGQTHRIINSGAHTRAFWADMWRRIASGKSWRGDVCNRNKKGSLFWVDSIILPYMDEDGHPTKFLAISNDITAAKQRERRMREETEKAKIADRAKSDFLANMSHEIRTPMNAIIGMTRLALRKNPDTVQLNYLKKIDNAAQSLLSIINDILDYSKIEAGKLELEQIGFSLEEVLNNLDDIVRERAELKGIKIVFSRSKETPRYLKGDPLRLGQILINLVNNAIKFTEKGRVIVEVKAEEGAGDTRKLRFLVSDTGIGMSSEQVSNLFKSFNQADTSITRKYGGTGLGLTVTKKLCELMRGTLDVESRTGEGSTFVFTATFGVAIGGVPLQGAARRCDLLKKSVLIVDDSESARDTLIEMLANNGLTAKAVSSGEEAIAAITAASDDGKPFDLVLMDYRMPGIDGVEASRRIKAQRTISRVPAVLMVSVFGREEAIGGVSDHELDGFLNKPVNESLLIDSIATIFGVKPDDPEADSWTAAGGFPAELVGRRVLLVEDNEANRELASELLSDLGILVTIAVNGREGVDRVISEPFDLVLMDIQMPVMDGLTATNLIRADDRFSNLPILAMTAHAMSGDRDRSLNAGMNDHITKPIDPNRLLAALIRWMPTKSEGPPKPVTARLKHASSVGGVPDDLPPFDIEAALARTDGKPKLLRKLMLGFRDQYTDAVFNLREHVAAGRDADAERLAHSLKSVAAMLEARDLADAAASVEIAFRSGETASINALIGNLESELDPAIAAVNSLDGKMATLSV
jgi:two-component system, sensor histidine kinase and response regulator